MEFKVEEKTKRYLEVNGFYVFKRTLTKVDRRTSSDPSLVPAFYGYSDWWYEEGYNHRVEFGEITRDMEEELVYVVDIQNLYVLEDLAKQRFRVTISNDFGEVGFMHKELNNILELDC